MIAGVALRLLGAHVERGSHGHTRLRQMHALAVLVAAEPEIGHFHPPLLGEQDVLGLDVAVDQTDLAGHPDGLTGLLHDRIGQRQVERTLLDEVVSQVRALDVLHRDEVHIVHAAQGVNVDNIRMIELGDGGRFCFETPEIRRVGREIGPEHLEGHGAVETDLGGQVNFAHPAATKELLDPEVVKGDAGQVARRVIPRLARKKGVLDRWSVRGAHRGWSIKTRRGSRSLLGSVARDPT